MNFPVLDFTADVLEVAPKLLGCELVRRTPKGILRGRIVEVEAYRRDDPASHAFSGPNGRAKTMFKGGGHFYVYFTYGMHHCINVVTGPVGSGQGILLRALEPLEGFSIMARNRKVNMDLKNWQRNLCSGPGKICQALGVDRRHDGFAFQREGEIEVRKLKNVAPFKIATSTRIGISKAKEKLWRFYVQDSPFVSK